MATFPGFGYAPGEIDRFLSLNAEPYEDVHYLRWEEGRVLAVAMRCGDLLEYVVPTLWERRYEAVTEAVAALKAAYPKLCVRVSEDLPSHASWYAALLPGLGFSMTPRVRMAASVTDLVAQPLRDVAAACRPIEPALLEPCVALHLAAYGQTGSEARETADRLRESFRMPDRRESWIVALHGEAPVGSCFGSHHRGRVFVEEIAVAEASRNQGLGRRLLRESVRSLARSFPEAETAVLDVDRINAPAVHLYTSLGFAAEARYTVAKAL